MDSIFSTHLQNVSLEINENKYEDENRQISSTRIRPSEFVDSCRRDAQILHENKIICRLIGVTHEG